MIPINCKFSKKYFLEIFILYLIYCFHVQFVFQTVSNLLRVIYFLKSTLLNFVQIHTILTAWMLAFKQLEFSNKHELKISNHHLFIISVLLSNSICQIYKAFIQNLNYICLTFLKCYSALRKEKYLFRKRLKIWT